MEANQSPERAEQRIPIVLPFQGLTKFYLTLTQGVACG
jgi:hypothetical protein